MKDQGGRAGLSRMFGLIGPLILWAAGAMLLAFMVAGRATAQDSGATEQQEPGWVGVRVVESSDTRIVLEVNLPAFDATRQPAGGRVYDLLSIPGWDLTQQPGRPQLPVKRVLLGIPPEAELRLAVLDTAAEESGPYRILHAPERVLVSEPFDLNAPWLSAPQFETRYSESPAEYGTDDYQPGAIARVGEVAWIRSQRVAAVDLSPILYNARTGRIRFHFQFRVELTLSSENGRQAASPAWDEIPAFEPLLQAELLNYEQSRAWRISASPYATRAASAAWPLPSDAYKITVTDPGLYQLTYDFLLQGGFSAETLGALDPSTLQLLSMGQEIPIWVEGEEDAHFDPGDYILFYGQALHDKYADENVYWLTYGQTAGRRMEVRDGKPLGALPPPPPAVAKVRIEEDRSYLPQWPGDDTTDRWYWQIIYSPPLNVGDPTFFTATVDLGHVSTEEMSSTLWVSMKGQSAVAAVNPDHHAEFYVNDRFVGEHYWDGADAVQWVPVDFPQDVLTSGLNLLRTEFPGVSGVPQELVLFDRYELTYGHAYRADSDQLEFWQASAGTFDFELTGFTNPAVDVYDITEALSVTRIVSGAVSSAGPSYSIRFSDTVPSTRTYLALTLDRWLEPVGMVHHTPANLRDEANAADYIIISHAGFLPAAHQLAAYRASQGLRTLVVEVQDVYDEFGFGLATAEAIRDFVRYAYDNWQATYLVLLGDGTYDPKNHLNQGAVSYLTPYLGFVDPWLGETATDNWFVAVSGEDILPDLHLGRLPANSLDEAQIMIDKIIAYEQAAEGAGWSNRLTFVAGLQPDPKGAGNFHTASDAILNEVVPAHYDISKVYLGAIPGSTCATGSQCQQQLVQAINAGTLLVNFIGHGSVIQWESIFSRSAIQDLSNTAALPVMLPMTCLDGYFIQAQRPTTTYPDYPSLSELLVRTAGKGAVASWGPTGLGVAYGHDQLDRGFLDALLLKGVRELGPATYAGKLRLFNAGYSLEQIQEYTVFGDPALRVKSPPADLAVAKTVEAPHEILPGDTVTFTLSFSNAGPGIAFGGTLADLLPPELVNPTIVSASPEVISQLPGMTFSWTLTNLWPHTGGEVRIRAEVDVEAGRLSFFNTATISASTPDLNLDNNRSKAGVGTKQAWLPLILKSP